MTLEAKLQALAILREHNYQYKEPFGELKAGFYWCLCGWEGPDRSSYWKHLESLLAERQELPFLFAIEDRQGKWKDGEQCVFGDAESAQEEVDLLNDAFDEGEEEYKVLPLYRAAQPSSGKGETK